MHHFLFRGSFGIGNCLNIMKFLVQLNRFCLNFEYLFMACQLVSDANYRLGKICHSTSNQVEENGGQKAPKHSRTSSMPPKDLASFAEEYRKLAIDCLKVLRVEMQLETIFHLQVCGHEW